MLDVGAEAKGVYGSRATQTDYAKTTSNVGSRGVHAPLCLSLVYMQSLRKRKVIVGSDQMAGSVQISRVMMGRQRAKVIVQQGSLLALAIQAPYSAEVVRHSLQVLRLADAEVQQAVVDEVGREGHSVSLALVGEAKCLRVWARQRA